MWFVGNTGDLSVWIYLIVHHQSWLGKLFIPSCLCAPSRIEFCVGTWYYEQLKRKITMLYCDWYQLVNVPKDWVPIRGLQSLYMCVIK